MKNEKDERQKNRLDFEKDKFEKMYELEVRKVTAKEKKMFY